MSLELIEETSVKEVFNNHQNHILPVDVDVQVVSTVIHREETGQIVNIKTLDFNILDLPEGKDRYFFVSYSSEDSQRVFRYVEDLERRFNLSCVYADRDFQPGKDISENIKDGMTRSLKVLLFLSPKFHESPWCKFEREIAFITSIENGTSCVIPVMLETCDLPTTLMSLTYVDATRPETDVPERIATALMQTFTADGFLPQNLANVQYNSENGYCFIMYAERDPNIWRFRPARYKFETTPEIFNKLKRCKVEVTEQLLENSINVVNKSSVMWSYDFLNRFYLLLWSLLFLLFVIYLVTFCALLITFTSATRSRFTDDEYAYITTIYAILWLVCPPTVLGILMLLVIFLPMCCHHKQRDLCVQRKLWIRFADEYINSNVLLIFSGRNKQPKLHIMRYNISRCKNYLKAVIMEQRPDSDDVSAEEEAASLIRRYLDYMLPTLADDFESLPEAPYNRHNVKKGKMCLCQYLEQLVFHPHTPQ